MCVCWLFKPKCENIVLFVLVCFNDCRQWSVGVTCPKVVGSHMTCLYQFVLF